ncbi:MAG: sigma-70 family RNA polymerase sigma factor [Phycisphaerales bacterium]|nr:sigma-70 family RNA polymerase sigma factor [Phycisphaerales bacterium]
MSQHVNESCFEYVDAHDDVSLSSDASFDGTDLLIAPGETMTSHSPSPLEQQRRRSRVDLQDVATAAEDVTSAAAEKKPAKATKKAGAKKATKVEGTDVAAAPVARKIGKLSAIDQELLATVMATEQDFIDSPAFYEDDASQKIYEEAPEIPKPDTTWYHPVMDDLSGRTRTIKHAQQVILTGAQEKVLFHQFNYARYRIWKIQQDVWATPSRNPTLEQAHEILRWYRKSDLIREQIANTNLALVLAMAKRARMSEVDFADLVSEGNMALLRAVDKFDAGRGYKFSTYACRAILKAFSRQGMKLSKYRQRFPTDFDPKLEKSNFLETKRATFEKDLAGEVKRIVLENRCELTDVERTVIEHRFGLESGELDKPMTLEQVGQIIGVTKERVRQIQNKAMEKIRVELEANFLGNKQLKEAAEAAMAASPEGKAPTLEELLMAQ